MVTNLLIIVENIEGIEDIKVVAFGQDESVSHELLEWRFRVEVVVAVGSR